MARGLRSRLARSAAGLLGAALIAAACLAPTQVTLRVTTDVDCAEVARHGTTFYRGDPVAAQRIASTVACSPGVGAGSSNDVGTLVVAPTGDREASFTSAVVLGVRVPTEECAARDYKGCIVARRRVTFIPHEPLEMPIALTLACLDVACSPDETCFRGACISATFEARDGCLGPECVASGSADGGTVDATIDDAPSEDATISDAVSFDAVASDGASPVRPFITDDGVTVSHVIPGYDVRGLTVDGTDVYFTVAGTAPPYRASVPTRVVSPLSMPAGDYYGIAVSATRYVVAGSRSADTSCAFSQALVGAETKLDCGGIGFGVGIDGTDTYVTRQPNSLFVRFGAAKDSVTPTASTSYAEFAESVFYAASGTGFISWAPPSAPLEVVTNGSPWRGLAVGPTHFFFVSQTGAVGASARGLPSTVNQFAIDAFSEAEDIAYDPSGALLVAAKRPDGSMGIWRLTSYEGLIP